VYQFGSHTSSYHLALCLFSCNSEARPLILTGDLLILARGLFDARRPPSLHLSKYKAKSNFLHFQYVYYTIITILNNIPFMIYCWRRTSCRKGVGHKLTSSSLSFSAVVRFPLCMCFPFTLGILLYPTAL
jgi:hypothetical protein